MPNATKCHTPKCKKIIFQCFSYIYKAKKKLSAYSLIGPKSRGNLWHLYTPQCVILGDNYESYDQATKSLSVEKLEERRQKLSLTFAKKCENNPNYSNWFKLSENVKPPNIKTRGGVNEMQPKYTPVPYRTDRYEKSPIPFLTKLLNDYYSRKK